MTTIKYAMALFALQLGSGCGFFFAEEPNYCGDALNHNCMNQIDAPLDAATGCKAAPDKCTGNTPACDMVADKCVECTIASHDLCTGVEPVCGADETCRGCTAHSECMSEVCLPDGSCAAEGDVAYVSGTGTGTMCTHATPCKTMTAAMAAAKPIVKAAGTITDAAKTTVSGRVVKIFADAGAKWTRGTSGPILELGSGGDATIFDLEISNASNTIASTDGVGISIPTGGAGQSLTLNRAKVSNCAGVGVKADGGTVTLTGATITANKGGGVLVAGGVFKITNTFIMDNGDASGSGSDFGGVQLSSIATGNVFEQNTVFANHKKLTGVGSPGVVCTVATLTAARNIVTRNNEDTSYPAQTVGVCAFGGSFTDAGTGPNDLKFVRVSAPLDLHLTAASPATVRDVVGVTACTGVDADGDPRPINTLCDFGADEFKP